MTTGVARHHSEWLSLIEVSGPFLTVPVLQRALPQGLEPVEPDLVAEVRRAHDEWREDPSLHGQWIRWVLASLLGLDETLKEGPEVPAALTVTAAEHRETLRPDLAVCEPTDDGKVVPRLLVVVWPEDVRLDERLGDRRWSATPLERMTDLLRATEVRLGLVTNGERWTLVHAPANGPTAYASWDADLWLEERSTLDAFATFLSARRFFGVPDGDTLEALLDESASAEQEVTDQLGRQVRQAVELLVDAFGRADREHRGTLLARIEPQEIYLAAVTVMMRLVFLLSAEERGLFLLGDPLYDWSYAVSTLRSQLQEEADRFGEEPLERRSSAWYRALGTFRMVYAGVQHENLRLPAYGGSLFDPDRFPFLEGRAHGQAWRDDPGRPLPVHDRTVLHMLDALQVLRVRVGAGVSEARRLSFRAIDVEQIGHVYEGLLDHTAVRVSDPAVGLDGKLEPEVALAELEERAHGDRRASIEWLAEMTGRTAKAIEKVLDVALEPHRNAQLLAACDNDPELAQRVAPFHGLLRTDLRGLPQVYVADSVYVTKAGERRSSGTYYTPRNLAEEMVEHALAPIVYSPGPAEGATPEDWKLKSPAELLELKLCDIAMGSGAFLVAATRYLADRLVEAWAETGPGPITHEGEPAARPEDAIPADPDDQLILARRLVADRCIYGVDKNPMAVDMAKLSMWLITLAKDRPFSFLDHALKPGDSLLGIHALAQIEHLHMDPERGRELHTTLDEHWHSWQAAVKVAIERRRELESFTVLTIRDAELKERLLREAEEVLDDLKVAGDVIVGAALSTSREAKKQLDSKLLGVAGDVAMALDPAGKEDDRRVRLENLRTDALYWLNEGKPAMQSDRRPFHWPLEFPEVFVDRGGFDALVGNPPFLGGVRVTEVLGDDYSTLLARVFPPFSKRVDLCAYFFRRATGLLRSGGCFGLLATNTISQGMTRRGGLEVLLNTGNAIYRCVKSFAWPGDASVIAARVWGRNGDWLGRCLAGEEACDRIGPLLEAEGEAGRTPYKLAANQQRCFQGPTIWGDGFFLSDEEATHLLREDERNAEVVRPFIGGRELNNSLDFKAPRWVIAMGERDLEEAQTFPGPLRLIEERVKPWRSSLDAKYGRVKKHWWKFFHARKDLFDGIREFDLERVLARSRVSDHHMVAFLDVDITYSDALVLFLFDDWGHFSVIQGSVHDAWSRRYASTLKTDVRYVPGDCFYTFPLPSGVGTDAALALSGEFFYRLRSDVMRASGLGLTALYNEFHQPLSALAGIDELRAAHASMDQHVLRCYGWLDVELRHGFEENARGLRWALEKEASDELLERLMRLNHERYAEEVGAGLHAKNKAVGRKRLARTPEQATLEGTT